MSGGETMVRTPETLTAAKRAAQLKIGQPGSSPKVTLAVASQDKPKKSSYEDIARKSLLGTPPPLNAMGHMSPTDVVDGSVSNLAITDIERYEHDPRIRANPRYDEIKASIRANGILNHISVTKRPGSTKYVVYGGGNTRLRIARELFEEGDQRFARLTVIVKVWKGDASTIAAHLVENEQRGDISFWEKAQGVLSFKANFEKERGSSLSASDLNRELKASGLNYGLRTLQNFMFAAEQLEPIGPWLGSREVNLIRPVLGAVLELASKLGQDPAAKSAMQGVLHRQAAILSSQPAKVATDSNLEGDEEVDTGLNTAALLDDVIAATAEALGYSADKLTAMARAIEANPRIATDTLLLVDAPPAPVAQQPAIGDAAAPATQAGAQQLQLGRMLSPVRTPTAPAGGPPTKHAPSPVAHHPTVIPALPQTHAGTGEVAPQPPFDLEPLFSTLGEIQNLVDLSDLIFTSDHPFLMFGIYLDLPKGGISHADSQALPQELIPYRLALWKLLVSLTGQLDRRCSKCLPLSIDGEDILWRQLVDQGEAAFHRTANELLGEPFESIDLSMLTMLFSHPELGYLVTRMLSQMEQIRVNCPERQLDGFVPLFAPEAS